MLVSGMKWRLRVNYPMVCASFRVIETTLFNFSLATQPPRRVSLIVKNSKSIRVLEPELPYFPVV
jgi:hypothetical protein